MASPEEMLTLFKNFQTKLVVLIIARSTALTNDHTISASIYFIHQYTKSILARTYSYTGY